VERTALVLTGLTGVGLTGAVVEDGLLWVLKEGFLTGLERLEVLLAGT
jgi:hypothetical protein